MGHHAIRLAAWRRLFASWYERRFRHWHAGKFWLSIRLRDDDIKTLFSQVTPGTKVNIINTRLKSLPNQTVASG